MEATFHLNNLFDSGPAHARSSMKRPLANSIPKCVAFADNFGDPLGIVREFETDVDHGGHDDEVTRGKKSDHMMPRIGFASEGKDKRPSFWIQGQWSRDQSNGQQDCNNCSNVSAGTPSQHESKSRILELYARSRMEKLSPPVKKLKASAHTQPPENLSEPPVNKGDASDSFENGKLSSLKQQFARLVNKDRHLIATLAFQEFSQELMEAVQLNHPT